MAKKKTPEVPENVTLEFSGGRKVELGDAFPLTIGDCRKLEDVGFLDFSGGQDRKSYTLSEMANALSILCAKVDNSITVEDIDSLLPHNLMEAMTFFTAKGNMGEEPHPT